MVTVWGIMSQSEKAVAVNLRKLVCFCGLCNNVYLSNMAFKLNTMQETSLGNYRRYRISLRNLECRKVIKFYSQITAIVPTIKK